MDQGEVTRLLDEIGARCDGAVDRLYPLVYDELRRLAQSAMGREPAGHTLQATALVHEAYLKLVDQNDARWTDRAHFFAIAAQAIRRILVDHARGRKRQKRGGGWERLDPERLMNLPADAPPTDLLALEEALEKLGREHPEKVSVVEMRFFAGLSIAEIAEVLGVTTRSVDRYWQFARAWLFRELCDDA